MKFIVIGCGRWGSDLATTLVRRGHSLTVIDRDPTAFERLGPKFAGRAIVGVGFDRDVLVSAGIMGADGLAAVMASDEANAVSARAARQFFRVPKVIARLNDPRKAEIYRRLGLQTISTVAWGVNRIAELLSYSELDVTASLGAGQVDLSEVDVPPMLVGQAPASLNLPGECIVAAVTRRDRTFLPASGMAFESGDRLHLVMLAASAERVKALLALK